MFEKYLLKIYNSAPEAIRNSLRKSTVLKSLRSSILNTKDSYKESKVTIERNYSNYKVKFDFYASIKVAQKVKDRGVENTLINNAIQLIKAHRGNADDAVVFDIGANFGYLSLVWAKSISQNGKVISFEPNPYVFSSFTKSIEANNLSSIIFPHNKAVGSNEGCVELYLNLTSSNTLGIDEQTGESITIEMVSMNSFIEKHAIKRCDLVKIDVDGIEWDILKGSQALIKKFRPLFVVETNDDERIIEFFHQNSYDILDMKLKAYRPVDKLPPNIFCIPNTI